MGAISSGFKSPLPHHLSIQGFRRIFRDGFGRGFSVLLLVTLQISQADRPLDGAPFAAYSSDTGSSSIGWCGRATSTHPIPARRLPRTDRRTYAAGRAVESRSGRPLLSLSSKPRVRTSRDRRAHRGTRRHHRVALALPGRADALRESPTSALRWGPVGPARRARPSKQLTTECCPSV